MSVLKDVTSNGANIATETTLSALNAKVPAAPATAGNQATEIASLASIDGKLPALAGGRVPVDASGVAVPVTDNGGSLTVDGTVSVSGSVTVADGARLNGSKGETLTRVSFFALTLVGQAVEVRGSLQNGVYTATEVEIKD